MKTRNELYENYIAEMEAYNISSNDNNISIDNLIPIGWLGEEVGFISIKDESVKSPVINAIYIDPAFRKRNLTEESVLSVMWRNFGKKLFVKMSDKNLKGKAFWDKVLPKTGYGIKKIDCNTWEIMPEVI